MILYTHYTRTRYVMNKMKSIKKQICLHVRSGREGLFFQIFHNTTVFLLIEKTQIGQIILLNYNPPPAHQTIRN